VSEDTIDIDAVEDRKVLSRARMAAGGTMDTADFRGALLAILERIAAALEAANANDPIAAIERALAGGEGGEGGGGVGSDGVSDPGADRLAPLPPDEEWRLR
jgi:hypothetical protein